MNSPANRMKAEIAKQMKARIQSNLGQSPNRMQSPLSGRGDPPKKLNHANSAVDFSRSANSSTLKTRMMDSLMS
jgi:hypothetical protein